MRRNLVVLFLLLSVTFSAAAAPPLEQLRGVIHLDTTVSGGEYGPEEMVRFLRDNELDVAIFTDQATIRWDYGVFPARWIMGWFTGWAIGKAFGRTGSVGAMGPRSYVALLDDLDKLYDKVVVIPGVEAIPFFHWEGSLLDGSFSLVNGYKHLLAFGMDRPESYEELPTVGEGYYRGYGIGTFLSLWPLGLIFLAYRCRKRAQDALRPALYRVPALLFLGIGLLFLLNNFPFKYGKYDQYHGDQGIAPYQDFIDYVVGQGGLIFWAHPEVSTHRVITRGPLKAHIRTEAYHEDLLLAHNYTGFGAFHEGMKYIIPPGGIWDQVLAQYCLGRRQRPVWAIAEGDVEGDQFSPKYSQTVFLVNRPTRGEVLDALREGRVYAIGGPLSEHLSMAHFSLADDHGEAIQGGTLVAAKKEVRILASAECRPNREGNALKVDLIRDGAVIKTFRGEGVLEVSHTDTPPEDGGTHFYRLDIRAPSQTRMISNPIFVQTRGS